MSYVALRFDADAEGADAWADALLEAGALSVDLSDAHVDTAGEAPIYDEPGALAAARWPFCRLTALFGSANALADALARLAQAGDVVPPHETFDVPDKDWVRATQAQFSPICISPRLWIVPSWREPVDAAAVNLVLDPGLAFGTGSHPTTRLCLRWLSHELRGGEALLDFGCGSGILAIAASRLGAARVVGADIDPQAIVASRENAKRNGVDAIFVPVEALPADEVFDVVVANILANPIISLAPALARRLRSGGRIVLSGILDAQADSVLTAYRPWFKLAVYESEDGWIALSGTRNATAA